MSDHTRPHSGPTEDAGVLAPHLYLPLRRYVERALSFLAEAVRADPGAARVLDLPAWHRDPDGVFRESNRQVLWSTDVQHGLGGLPEHAEALRALRADQRAADQLDTLIGTARSAVRLEARALLESLVRSSFDWHAPFRFDESGFDDAFLEFARLLDAETLDEITLLPLSGISATAPGPITLSEVCELDVLTDDEVSRTLSIGAIGSSAAFRIWSNDPPLWGLRVRSRVPKVTGEQSDIQAEMTIAAHHEEATSTELDQAVAALRIYKRGQFRPLARMTFIDVGLGLGQGTAYSVLSPTHFPSKSYKLSEADREGLHALARVLASDGLRRRPWVGNSVRRFVLAGDRGRADDQLVDLMIAAESLFLGHIPEREGELRFRLSLYAAHLLGSTEATRQRAAKQIRRAYDTRSAIVHGGVPTPDNWGSTEKDPVTLPQFTASVHELMRQALHSAVHLSAASRGKGPFFDWDAAVLAGGTA